MAETQNADPDPGRQWMLEVQQGDQEAFRRIVHHYGRRIVAFFRRCGADAATAEDLGQEAFLRIYRARDRYRPSARFSTWLHRIMTRMAINVSTRDRWRRAVPLGPTSTEEDPGSRGVPEPADDPDTDPVRVLDLEEVRARVRTAVCSLPENQRVALILNRFEGLSYEELAVTLDLSVPAVKSLLFRARDGLRKTLAPLLREEVNRELS